MKKILISILGILIGFVGVSSASFSVIVHYNGTTTTYTVSENEGNLYLNGGNWSESNDYYTYNGYTYTDITYMDGYGKIRTDRTISDIYLNGYYVVGYTGDGYTVLTNNDCGEVFTGYFPTFEVTGNIQEINTGNVFGDFAQNSLNMLLSNIPNYIQYVIMFIMLLLILGVFRKFK